MPSIETMIDWYYRTPSTQRITTRVIGYEEYCVEMVSVYGDTLKVQSFTIGRNQIAAIRDNYMHYQRT